MSGANWMAHQLVSLPQHRSRNNGFNPRPPGVVQPGSASDAVLSMLAQEPSGRFFTYGEIRARVSRSHAATSFAVLYLRRAGLIEATGDARNASYLRYRAVRRLGGQGKGA